MEKRALFDVSEAQVTMGGDRIEHHSESILVFS
jgi:hypothetical protein